MVTRLLCRHLVALTIQEDLLLDKGFKAHINLAKNEQCLDKEIRSNKKSYFYIFQKPCPTYTG